MTRAPLRHALRAEMHQARGSSGPTPFSIFGPSLVHEWDPFYSTITIATGVSSMSDRIGSDNLTQGTGAAQPALTSSGLQSYVTGNASQWLEDLTIANFGGVAGGLTLIFVGRLTTVAGATTKSLLDARSSVGAVCSLIRATSGGAWAGIVNDATGADTMTGGTADTTRHLFLVANNTGVSRRLIVDGTVTNGARTQALTAGERIGLLAAPTGGSPGPADANYAALVTGAVTNAQLNSLGAWATARFGTAWVAL